MLENFLSILTSVRENILEAFIIPGLNISYWDFCLSLLIIGLIIKVLVNGAPSKHRSNAKSNSSRDNSSESE